MTDHDAVWRTYRNVEMDSASVCFDCSAIETEAAPVRGSPDERLCWASRWLATRFKAHPLIA